MNSNIRECCEKCRDIKGEIHHCDCHPLSLGSPTPTTEEDIVQEFDENHYNGFISVAYAEDCKTFLRTALRRNRISVIEEVLATFPPEASHTRSCKAWHARTCTCGMPSYNRCLEKIRTTLQDMKDKKEAA